MKPPKGGLVLALGKNWGFCSFLLCFIMPGLLKNFLHILEPPKKGLTPRVGSAI